MTTEKSDQNTMVVVKKYGEVTRRELFKVRGDHVWQPSVAEALRCHKVNKQFWENYGKEKR